MVPQEQVTMVPQTTTEMVATQVPRTVMQAVRTYAAPTSYAQPSYGVQSYGSPMTGSFIGGGYGGYGVRRRPLVTSSIEHLGSGKGAAEQSILVFFPRLDWRNLTRPS